MRNQQWGASAKAKEQSSPNKGREADLNKERLIFVLTSLVGQRVTARLRGDVAYEGLFHSFSHENDYAITLKSARKLASESAKSGKVMEALIIPGKDFLQVSAVDVPSTSTLEAAQKITAGGFKTDGEISRQVHSSERQLVAWGGGDDGGVGGLDDSHMAAGNGTSWDQFATNEHMFGVSTSFNEELYTTKLDPNSIPREKREEAERLAKEIENGNMQSELDAKCDGEDDEEGRFSAVTGTGAYKDAIVGTGSAAPSAKARGANGRGGAAGALSQIPPMPEDRFGDVGGQSKRLAGGAGGQMTPQMMKTSMISEMKRINALNLEPAVPKLEDKSGAEWINFQAQNRNMNKAPVGNGLKQEFQQSLDLFHKREATKLQQQKLQQQQQDNQSGNSSSDNWRGGKGGHQLQLPPEALQQGNMMQQRGGGNAGGDSTRSKGFQFNTNAKEFSFNPGASSFTPSNAAATFNAGGQTPSGQGGVPTPTASGNQMSAQVKSMAPSPPFNMFAQQSPLLGKSLEQILDGFYDSSKSEAIAKLDPTWPEAQGPSYHEVLGQPNPANPLPPQLHGNMAPNQQMAPWQQQQQQPPQQQQPMGNQAPPAAGGAPPVQGGNAPQMMPQQGFMMPPGGQNNQMFQPMFQGPGNQMPPQRPQNAGNMPPQEQQPMQFQQQNMMAPQQGPGQAMAVPSGMVNQQGGQNPGGMMMQPMGGAMPKFGGGVQVMMMPTGQYAPQGGFPQQQGQPGQPGPQPGGPPGGPQQPGHWQQAPHMMPVHMQQVGPRGPHNMGGHE